MNKKRGCNAERELLHLLSKQGFSVARVAGSGMIAETNCDLFVSNGRKKYAVEVKISSNSKKYLSKEQMTSLIEFSKSFGLSPIVAIKFLRQGWWFIHPDKLNTTGKGLAISFDDIKKRGKNFDKFIK